MRKAPGNHTYLADYNKQERYDAFLLRRGNRGAMGNPCLRFDADNIPLGRGLLQPHTSYTPDGKGGNTLFLPIPYAKSCKVTFEYPEAVEPTPKYYQINYRKYPQDVVVETFSAEGAMAIQDKIAEVDKTLLAPPTYKAGKTVSVSEQVSAGQSLSLSELPRVIRLSGIWIFK